MHAPFCTNFVLQATNTQGLGMRLPKWSCLSQENLCMLNLPSLIPRLCARSSLAVQNYHRRPGLVPHVICAAGHFWANFVLQVMNMNMGLRL